MTSALFIGGSQPASSLPVESACGTLSGAGTVDTSSPTIAAASAADCAALALALAALALASEALAEASFAFAVARAACVEAVSALASAEFLSDVTEAANEFKLGTIVLKDSPHAFSAGLNASARSRNTVSVSVAVFGGIGRTGSVVIAIISS